MKAKLIKNSETIDRTRIYNEGMMAAYNGKIAADCPYEYSSVEGELWLSGYEDAGGVE